MTHEKPAKGTWELTSPDGSIYEAETPLKCVRAERHDRIGEEQCARNLIKALRKETEDYRKMFSKLKAEYIFYIYCIEHPPAMDADGGREESYNAYRNSPIFNKKVNALCRITFGIIKEQCGSC